MKGVFWGYMRFWWVNEEFCFMLCMLMLGWVQLGQDKRPGSDAEAKYAEKTHLQENMFSFFEHESLYMVYNINRWPQIYICKVLRFALVIRWIEPRTVCYLSIPSYHGYLMPFLCHWSDHSFRMPGSGHLARRLYVFWYHSFLIRTGISFQTSCKLPLATTLPFCFILIDLAVLHIVNGVSWRLLLLIFWVRAHFRCLRWFLFLTSESSISLH